MIENRQKLDDALTYFKEKFPTTVPRPSHWGGFCVDPNYFEFWQGRANRYHDRITYNLVDNSWNINRLCP